MERLSYVDKGSVSKQFNYVQKGERATTLIASETYGENGVRGDKLTYTYDKRGNVCEIRKNGELVVRYGYDELNRVIREDNRKLGKTFFTSYDSAGNIVQRKECAFTLDYIDNLEKSATGSYIYADNGNKDQLLSFNGEAIEYNVLGNPTKYRNKTLTWSFVNRLASFGDVSFKYNYAGIRLFKTVGDKTTKYYCDGAKIICQDDGTDNLYFYYGTEGVTAFKYNEEVYHYKKDMFGNILGIYDANGQLLVKYVYDAWGNHKTLVLENNLWVDITSQIEYTDSSSVAEKIAILNPFRYRSYYYDIETGLYYLQSRYYDPEVGRFISMDSIEYLDPESIHGLNLYAYCANNPVMAVDPSGHDWNSFCNGVGNWFKDNWVKLAVGAAFVVGGALITALTAGTGVGFMAAFGSALLSSSIQVGISVATSVLIGGVVSVINGGGFFDNFGENLASGFMWGGIFAGGAQIIGGAFRIAANSGVATGRHAGIRLGKSGLKILSPDKNNWAKAGGTLIKFGEKVRFDIGAMWGLHLHILKSGHIPIGSLIAGLLGAS